MAPLAANAQPTPTALPSSAQPTGPAVDGAILRPVRAVILVDESGSLTPADVEEEKAAAQVLAFGAFSPDSEVAVVGYGSSDGPGQSAVDTVCPLTGVDSSKQDFVAITLDPGSKEGNARGTVRLVDAANPATVHEEAFFSSDVVIPPPWWAKLWWLWLLLALLVASAAALLTRLRSETLKARHVGNITVHLSRGSTRLANLPAPVGTGTRFAFTILDAQGAVPRLGNAFGNVARPYVVTRNRHGQVQVRTPEGTEHPLSYRTPVPVENGLTLTCSDADTTARERTDRGSDEHRSSGSRRGHDPYENATDPYGRSSSDASTVDPYTGQLAPGSRRAGPPRPAPGRSIRDHVDADSDERVRLDIRARMDSAVGVGEVARVTVLLSRLQLSARPSAVDASGEARAVPGNPVVVEVVSRANLEVVGPAGHEIAVPDSEQVDAVVFHVRATHAGRGELWVVVRQDFEMLLAPLVLAPEVTPTSPHRGLAELAAEGTFARRERPSGAPAPHVLRINEERHGDRTVYRYDIEAHDLELLTAFASPEIISDRDAYVRGLYKKIENCWVASRRDEEKFGEELRAFGADLLDELVPHALQRLLCENRHRLRDILVLSTEPFIPWELLHLKDPTSGRLSRDETCFLGQLGVVRWLWGPYPPEELWLRPGRARHIIPDYPDPDRRLPEASAERAFVEQATGATAVPPHHREVLEALRDDDLDLLHFSGHGVASTDDIADAHLLLEGHVDDKTYVEEPLRVSVVRHNFDRNSPEHGHPVVVVNACQTGRLGRQLSTIGGFAEAFVKGGTGVFVGCLWSVGDAPARVFVEEFYRHLLDGGTVSEATVAGREKAREAGDATWLAYTVYAHPHAHLVSGTAEPDPDPRVVDR